MSSQLDALCCTCGTVRRVGIGACTKSGNRVLKCGTCGAPTMHAIVGRAEVVDWREWANRRHENLDYARDPASTQPPLPTEPPETDVLEATARKFGIRVVVLPNLPEPILYLPEQHMALVDADLTDEARAEASDWLLGAV